MSTVVYLSNKHVQVVEGRYKDNSFEISRCITDVLPEGCLINGVIMNQMAFGEFIRNFWKTNNLSNEISLVINSTRFVGQTIEMPAMRKKEESQYIRREFAPVDKLENRIHGYISLNNANTGLKRFYAESVSPDFVNEYVGIFKSSGIKVKQLYSGESSLIRLASRLSDSKTKNYIMFIADGIYMEILLFIGGRFTYYNSARAFHNRGSEEYAQDIVKLINHIRQFMKSEHIVEELDAVVLAGMNSEESSVYANYLAAANIFTPVNTFNDKRMITGDAAPTAQYCLHAVSGLLAPDKNNNFAEIAAKHGKIRINFDIVKAIIPIALTAAIMLMILSITSIEASLKKNEYDNAVKNNVYLKEAAEEYDESMRKTVQLENTLNTIDSIKKNLVTYPVATSDVIEYIKKIAEGKGTVDITGFSSNTGELIMTVTSNDTGSISELIKTFINDSIFADVRYSGYQEQGDIYYVDVKCILSSGAGKETK